MRRLQTLLKPILFFWTLAVIGALQIIHTRCRLLDYIQYKNGSLATQSVEPLLAETSVSAALLLVKHVLRLDAVIET